MLGTTGRTATDERAKAAGKNSVRKKTKPTKAGPKRPFRKELDCKSESNKLACRYCGSADLAPGFIKRRDRRWELFQPMLRLGGSGEPGEGYEVAVAS